jgi:hypothetical protein
VVVIAFGFVSARYSLVVVRNVVFLYSWYRLRITVARLYHCIALLLYCCIIQDCQACWCITVFAVSSYSLCITRNVMVGGHCGQLETPAVISIGSRLVRVFAGITAPSVVVCVSLYWPRSPWSVCIRPVVTARFAYWSWSGSYCLHGILSGGSSRYSSDQLGAGIGSVFCCGHRGQWLAVRSYSVCEYRVSFVFARISLRLVMVIRALSGHFVFGHWLGGITAVGFVSLRPSLFCIVGIGQVVTGIRRITVFSTPRILRRSL